MRQCGALIASLSQTQGSQPPEPNVHRKTFLDQVVGIR